MPPLSREPLPCVVGRTCVLRRRKIYTEVSRGVVAHDRVTPRESAALFWVGKACFGGGLGGERGACVFQPAPDVWPVWGHERDAWGLVPDAKFVHTRQTQPAPTHVCPNPGAQRERATTTNACVAVQTRRRVLQTPATHDHGGCFRGEATAKAVWCVCLCDVVCVVEGRRPGIKAMAAAKRESVGGVWQNYGGVEVGWGGRTQTTMIYRCQNFHGRGRRRATVLGRRSAAREGGSLAGGGPSSRGGSCRRAYLIHMSMLAGELPRGVFVARCGGSTLPIRLASSWPESKFLTPRTLVAAKGWGFVHASAP